MENAAKKYFENRKDVAFAFLFGSHARGNATIRSDVDIAVYFYPEKRRPLEVEEEVFYEGEDRIWADLERLFSKEVELLVLNRVPATVGASAIKGTPITINDWGLYLDFMVVVTDIAEDFREFIITDYMERAGIEKEVKARLVKHIAFLEEEIEDYALFRQVRWDDYRANRSTRRDLERWIENIINSSIDIAKIILSSEGMSLSDTYRELVLSLSLVKEFDSEEAEELSKWVRFRNIISHEYLDIRWTSIKRFIAETEPLYKRFLNSLKEYVKKTLQEE